MTRYKSYKKSLQELDLDALEQRREKLCLNFALKAIGNEMTKHMFPRKDTKHKHQTRNGKLFKVEKANTNRLKDFAIIYMQRLLNKYAQKQTA